MQSNQELISRIQNGDIRAFKILVQDHQRLVISMVTRLISQKEDIEDVCQEVFIKVHKSLHLFKFQSQLSTWIGRIAYTTAINHLKKTSGRLDKTDSIDEMMHDDIQFAVIDNAHDLVSKKEVSVFIQQEVQKLPAQYRAVITLFHLNELSHAEVGEITGMPEGTVKNYLFRARKLLKDKLESYLK